MSLLIMADDERKVSRGEPERRVAMRKKNLNPTCQQTPVAIEVSASTGMAVDGFKLPCLPRFLDPNFEILPACVNVPSHRPRDHRGFVTVT